MISPIRVVTIKIASLFLLLISISACQSSSDNDEFSFDGVPEITPELIISTEHIDSLYFGFLGISSSSLPDGDVILTVWDPSVIVRSNADFTEIKAITNVGRGPGEMLSTGEPIKAASDHLSTFDQFQNKVLVFGENFEIEEEYIPASYKNFSVKRIFELSDSQVVFEMRSTKPFIIGEEEHKVLAQFDAQNQTYLKAIQLFTKPYAPLGPLIGNVAGASMAVPYSNNQFIELHPKRNTLFLFDTRTDIIAEMNADFDTLNSISVQLPKEKLTQTEKESLKSELPPEEWKAFESYLSEYKAIANKMLLSEHHVWLESNLDSDFAKWFVLNMDGEIERIVNLPKGSRLTHISDHHLGVRLNDVTFALYEPITDSQD